MMSVRAPAGRDPCAHSQPEMAAATTASAAVLAAGALMPESA